MPFVQEILLFVLVFVVIFAILQKSKVLGDGKKQIDSLVALVMGLIFVAVASATGIVFQMVAWTAVAVVVILLFLLLMGFVLDDKWKENNFVKKGLPGLIIVFIVILVLYTAGWWDTVWNWVTQDNVVGTIILLAVIGGAVWAVWGTKSGD